MSPKTWREVYFPGLKRMCTEFHKFPGVKIIYHGCGDAREILSDLIEAGIDTYHTLEVKVGWDLAEVREKFRNRLDRWGNIDARNVLTGYKELIKKTLLEKLEYVKDEGYIPTSGHSISENVPVENYDYFVQLIFKKVGYPLKFPWPD